MTIDERIASELRRQAPQVDEQMAWDRIESAAPLRRRGRAIRLLAVSAALLHAASASRAVAASVMVESFIADPMD